MEDYMNLEGFTIRPYRMKRLAEYSKRMSKDNERQLMDDNVLRAMRLQSLPVEEDPRSVYKVRKLYEALHKYSPRQNPKVRFNEFVESGIDLAYTCFARPDDHIKLNILELSPSNVELLTSNPSGSAGLTAYGESKAQSKVRALNRALQILSGEKAPEPCLAFKRTQFDDKTRLIWGYPYSMTIIEGLTAYPLLKAFKGGRTPMAFAMPNVALGARLRVASYHNRYAYSIDMSQFDSTISGKLIHIAFNIIKTWFDMNQIEPVSGSTVGEIFNLVEKYFITTPIVMPNQRLYLGKDHGVPSGSYFTQLVDSIVNTIVAGTISMRFSLHVSPQDFMVLGDDLLMWSNRLVDLNDVANYINKTLGIKMHGSEKSAVCRYDEPVHFLGKMWTKGIPDLPRDEILKRMLFPERFRRYSGNPIVRDKEVKLLIGSYATQYWSAYRILQDVFGSDLWFAQDSAIVDQELYDQYGGSVNPDHVSGLMRYRLKYTGMGQPYKLNTTANLFLT